MKWIAVILALLNLIAFLLMKSGPAVDQTALDAGNEVVNAASMTVIAPEVEDLTELESAKDEPAALGVEEEDLAQLKVDNRGKVLMARDADQKNTADQAESAQTLVAETVVAGAASSPAVDAPPVSTLKPLDRSQPSEPVVKTTQLDSKPKIAKPAAVASVPDPVPAPDVAKKLACYRVGPFVNQNQLGSVRRKLESRAIKYKVEEKTAPGKIKAVRVYLGAFSGDNALNEQKQRLEKMKIEYFVIRLNGERLIQLGYFSKPDGAKKYQQKLKSMGVDAKTSTIYRDTAIESWLELKSVSRAAVDELAMPKQINVKEEGCL